MMRGVVRLGVAFGLTGCFWFGACQQTGSGDRTRRIAPDPALYESFFVQVVQLKQSIKVSGPTLHNGQPDVVVDGAVVWTPIWTQPTDREAIGLTDQESLALNEVASDCQAKILSLNPAIDRLVLEARLERIRTESTPASLVKQMKDIEGQRTQMVLDHIQQLKAAFGDARFEMLDSWVHSRKEAASFFPPVTVEKSGRVGSSPAKTQIP
jgi:hypothetical protein